MDMDFLEKEFKIADKSTAISDHLAFKKLLLSSDKLEVISYHFDLFKRTKNEHLFQTLTTFFKWRGVLGESFLLDRMKSEKDPHLLAIGIQILGSMKSKQALPLARSFLTHKDARVRERACIVLGWVGMPEDIKRLAHLQLSETDINTRKWASTQQMHILFRFTKTKMDVIKNLKNAIESETNDEVIGDIIYTAQEVLKRRFGIKEDKETRKMIGDLHLARKKALTALTNYIIKNKE